MVAAAAVAAVVEVVAIGCLWSIVPTCVPEQQPGSTPCKVPAVVAVESQRGR